MPAKTEKQRKAAGTALHRKRSGTGKLYGASKGMVKSMSEKELSKMASKKKKRNNTRRVSNV